MYESTLVTSLSTICLLDLDLIPYLEDLYRSTSGVLSEDPFTTSY